MLTRPAAKHPAPIGERPDGQREAHLGHALDHEIDDQEHAEQEQPGFGLAQQQEADDDREHDGDQLQPEMRHLARADQADALHDAADDQDPGKQKDNPTDAITG